MFTGKESRKAIQILEDAEIIAIDSTQLFKLYDSYPEIERLFRKIFEAGYVETVNRIEGMQFHSAEERYNALLSEAPNVLNESSFKVCCLISRNYTSEPQPYPGTPVIIYLMIKE